MTTLVGEWQLAYLKETDLREAEKRRAELDRSRSGTGAGSTR
jgi:hypothetical protein